MARGPNWAAAEGRERVREGARNAMSPRAISGQLRLDTAQRQIIKDFCAELGEEPPAFYAMSKYEAACLICELEIRAAAAVGGGES